MNKTNEGMIPCPTITILEGNNEKLYRLPLELNEWTYDSVAMANTFGNLFPSKVEFCNINGKLYADFSL